jgi:CMP-N-acetylneuraminic acid synthetase
MRSSIFCVIPARGGSKRFPRKNLALLAGKPLLCWAVEAATGSGVFDRILVSTEDHHIARVAEAAGASILHRPGDLASDTATGVDVCLHAIREMRGERPGYDAFACLLPTSPLRTANDIGQAYQTFVARDADFLMAVTSYAIPPFWALEEHEGFLRPRWGREYLVKSQELPPVCVDNGAIYIARIEAFERERTFYGARLVGFPMPRERSIDVDEPVDLRLAEFFLEQWDDTVRAR